MKTLPSLSIFFPAFNDANTIPSLVARAYETGSHVTRDLEVIIVNDGSTDDTEAVLRGLQKKYPTLRVITHDKNKGYGAALTTGLRAARKAWVFYTDGDGQYDPTELKLLVRKLRATTDVVNGYKIKRADSWLRTAIGNVYNWWVHRQFTLPIRDVDCDFRLMRTSMLKRIRLTSQSGTICLELITKLQTKGARFAEVAVHHYPRRFGRSQFFRPQHIFTTLREYLP